ncbi:phosphorylase b kinase gamma catalytic chain, skeletal muscle/heart isoform-like [Diadema setosum]|uniref:phosphorylase b kinase gamma catalytic chain, skeletal muscle/heart isoform-like n=1 Tax=Diadema setosum TaxID=31175 RepID=UPI003B3B1030
MTVEGSADPQDETDFGIEYDDAFSSKYIAKHVLGRGVSSTVRLCADRQTHEEYAVKIIDITNQYHGDDNRAKAIKEEYRNEVMIINTLSEGDGHPNIIKLIDFIESPTYFFLVFELCPSGELFDYLTDVVTLSEKKTRAIMRSVISAVAYIHSNNIVHRDLKPENILLDSDMRIKISDFGMAAELSGGVLLRELCGTPGYMAPEMLKCSMGLENITSYGQKIDLWACGVIMFTLLVGRPPFWHRKKMLMLRAIMEGRYRFGSPEWDDITDMPKDLISKLLVVDPKLRLTAKEALEHPFFQQSEVPAASTFNARRKFKAAGLVVYGVCRMRRHSGHRPVSPRTIQENPYAIKAIRKALDGCAFDIYRHWVKKGQGQDRAALFATSPKMDIKNTLGNSSGPSSRQETPTMSPSSSWNPNVT